MMRAELASIGLAYAHSKGLKLYPFQEVGVELMHEMVKARSKENEDSRGGVLLFDEMGLGKTIEFIAFVSGLEPRPRRILIVCPNTLKLEWKAAFEKWLNPEELEVVATGRGGLKRFNEILENPRWFTVPTRIIVTNYETFRSRQYLEILQVFRPQVIGWDEAHRMRNWSKKTARATREVSAPIEVLMTGTPIVNHAGDLWALVQRVSPEIAGKPSTWEETFTYSQGYGRMGGKRVGVKNRDMLYRLLDKVAIQRKKEEVLKDLPKKVIREVPLEMEEPQRAVYTEMETKLFTMLDSGESLTATSVLAHLMRLRQLCCDPRIVGISEWGQTGITVDYSFIEEGLELYTGRAVPVAELLDSSGRPITKALDVSGIKTEFLLEYIDSLGKEQLVVFSNFEQYISLIERLLPSGVTYTRLTGKEKGETRARNIERFQRGEFQIILGTTQAGGEGVNLQCASKIVLLDRWWSPVRNDQAIDRLHRIGQENQVQVVIPHCVDSIDDALREILDRKYTVINELRIRTDTVEKLREYRGRRQNG